MNMFARFDENPEKTLQDIKKKKKNVTDGRMDNVKTVYPPQTKFAGNIIIKLRHHKTYSKTCIKQPLKNRHYGTTLVHGFGGNLPNYSRLLPYSNKYPFSL